MCSCQRIIVLFNLIGTMSITVIDVCIKTQYTMMYSSEG